MGGERAGEAMEAADHSPDVLAGVAGETPVPLLDGFECPARVSSCRPLRVAGTSPS